MNNIKWKKKKVIEERWFHLKQEAQGPSQSPEYQRIYTNFLSEGLIFAYELRQESGVAWGKKHYIHFIQ